MDSSSDSECYESADEDIIPSKTTPTNTIDKELETLKLDDNKAELNQRSPVTIVTECNDEENLWGEDELKWGDNNDEDTMSSRDLWIDNELHWGKSENVNVSNINQITRQPSPESTTNSSNPTAWSGWTNWGVSTVLSTASNLIGAPPPEELAASKSSSPSEGDDHPVTVNSSKSGLSHSIFSGVTQITRLVENTGTKVISGGLDTLETIGRRTMEVLQEGDPGLRRKRTVLSQILREAKERAEANENTETAMKLQQHKGHNKTYESLFDDHQGLIHLEALEMLSKQCQIKLKIVLEESADRDKLQEIMDGVCELYDLPSSSAEQEDNKKSVTLETLPKLLDAAVNELKISLSYDRLIATCSETENWLKTLDLKVCDAVELFEQALVALAQITAIAVEQYHKCGELLLIKEVAHSTVAEADSLVQLTLTLQAVIVRIATQFADKLNEKNVALPEVTDQQVIDFITNIYIEMENSNVYIQKAFQMLLPVLQIGAI